METRQIKFRAWDKKRNEMFKVNSLNTFSDRTDNPMQVRRFQGDYSEDFVLMQFTGLLDKNGKEIYESDLVKAKRGNTSLGDMNDLYEIVWHELYACFSYKCVKSDNPYRLGKIAESNSHPFFVSSSITEVIGNVFENANLTTGS